MEFPKHALKHRFWGGDPKIGRLKTYKSNGLEKRHFQKHLLKHSDSDFLENAFVDTSAVKQASAKKKTFETEDCSCTA